MTQITQDFNYTSQKIHVESVYINSTRASAHNHPLPIELVQVFQSDGLPSLASEWCVSPVRDVGIVVQRNKVFMCARTVNHISPFRSSASSKEALQQIAQESFRFELSERFGACQ